MWRSVGGPARTAAAWILACLLCGAARGADSVPRPVDRIEIERWNVFPDTTGDRRLPGFYRLLNRLHPRTRAYVIRREIPFRAGDRPDSADIAEAERLVRRRGLFESVRVWEDPDSGATGARVVRVRTHDLWSTSLIADYEKQADLSEFTIGVRESNLLGTGNTVHYLQVFSTDRDYFLLATEAPRILGSRTGLSALYAEGEDGVTRFAALGRTLESHADRDLHGARVSGVTGRRRFYAHGDERGVAAYRRDLVEAHLGRFTRGESRRGAGLGVLYAHTTPRGTPEPEASWMPPPPAVERIRFTGPMAFGGWMSRRFVACTNRDRYGAREDIAYGWAVQAAAAPNLVRDDEEDNGADADEGGKRRVLVADLRVQAALPIARTCAAILDAGSTCAPTDGIAQGETWTYGTGGIVWQPHPRLLGAVQGSLSSATRFQPARVMYLGGSSGLRGYPTRYFEVRDYALVTLEQRAWSGLEVLWVGIGANLFADAAFFAEPGSGDRARWRSGWGAGLLLGLRKSSQKPVRIEVAWRTDAAESPTFSVTTSSILRLATDLDFASPAAGILSSVL